MLGRIMCSAFTGPVMVLVVGVASAAPPPVAKIPMVRSLGLDCRTRNPKEPIHIHDAAVVSVSDYTAYCAIDGVAAPVAQIGSARLYVRVRRPDDTVRAELCFRPVSGLGASCGPRVHAPLESGDHTLVLKPPAAGTYAITDVAFIRFYMPSGSSYHYLYGYEVLRHVPLPSNPAQ